MRVTTKLTTLAACALFCVLGAGQVHAQAQGKAYAPRDLTVLNVDDRTRVIEKEYAEQSGGRVIPDDQLDFYLDQIESGWTWDAIKDDIAQSLAGSGGWRAAPPPRNVPPPRPERPRVVEVDPRLGAPGSMFGPGVLELDCQSRKFRYTTCRTGVRARFELIGQYGKSACVEGRTWGQSPGLIWVDKGCRARFVEAQAWSRPWRGGAFVCASDDGAYRECRIPFRGRVVLNRSLSRYACVEGRTWGQRDGWMWVDGGCRGEFELVGRGRPSTRVEPLPDGGIRRTTEIYTVTCVSENDYHTCSWDESRGRPVLIENLSRNRCIEGETWGYSRRRGLWVDEGCRGRFGTED